MWQACWQPPVATVGDQRPHEPGGGRGDDDTHAPRHVPDRAARCPGTQELAVVISIAMLTAGSDPAGYYLARRAGCLSLIHI